MSCKKLFHCIGLAVAEKGLKGIAGAVPFGAVIYDIAFNARERYLKECMNGRELEDISFAANASPDQIKGQVAEVVAEIQKNAPPLLANELRKPEIEQKLKNYLQQVPSAIRASMRRPSDPSGKSLASGFSLGKNDAFLKLLPENLPKFKAGDSPVGNWKLVELLGVGGFGEVWKAEHPSLKGIPPVALKFCLSPESARFIRHEGQLLSRVMECSANNPGIVKLKQAYIDSEINCLEYEYVNGGDLCGLLADWLQLPKEKRFQVALQMLLNLARTIAPLHRMTPPIVHRDLKPANILIVKTDNKILLKVTDFGIGGFASHHLLTQNTKGFDQANILTQTLRGSHTPLYASPEQQKGETPHPTDDVHALGVIGLQLLLCDLTIGPAGDWDVELKTQGVNDQLIELLKKCFAKKERRIQDALALAIELQKLISEKTEGSSSKIIPNQGNLNMEGKSETPEANSHIWASISEQKRKSPKSSNLRTKKFSFLIASGIVLVLISAFAVFNHSKKNDTQTDHLDLKPKGKSDITKEVKITSNKDLNFSFEGTWLATYLGGNAKLIRIVTSKKVMYKDTGWTCSWAKNGNEIHVKYTSELWDKLTIDDSNPNILNVINSQGRKLIWKRLSEDDLQAVEKEKRKLTKTPDPKDSSGKSGTSGSLPVLKKQEPIGQIKPTLENPNILTTVLPAFSVNNTGRKYDLSVPPNYSKVEFAFYRNSPVNLTLNGAWNSVLSINQKKIIEFRRNAPNKSNPQLFYFDNLADKTIYKESNNENQTQNVKFIDITSFIVPGENNVYFYHEQRKEIAMGLVFKIHLK